MKTYSLLTLSLMTILLAGCGGEKKRTYQGDLHYTLTGQGDTALVFTHGWGINGDYWNNQVEAFKDRYTVVTLDLPGHGKSPLQKKDMTIGELGAAVADLVAQLDLEKVVLVGHSMSGDVNLYAYPGIQERVIGFIGVDNLQTVGYDMPEAERKEAEGYFQVFGQDFKGAARQFSMAYLFHPQTDSLLKERVVSDIVGLDPQFGLSTLRAASLDMAANQKKVLPQLQVPLLLIVAEGTVKDETSLKTYCTNGYRYWNIAGTGHYPMIEKPQEFNVALTEALKIVQHGKSR